jgi:hypothetical protein
MGRYVCPLNKRPCRCDPAAIDRKFQPCALAKRIGTLIRLMGSDFEGEATGAVAGLRRLLPGEGLTFGDIAIAIENCNGEIEQLKYSDTDAEAIYTRGVEKGREKGRAEAEVGPAEYFESDGTPKWPEIAMFCQRKGERLHETERDFVDDMAGSTMWRIPTEKQGKWLLSIFIKLGGRRKS